MSETKTELQDTWALVEIMGRQRIVGQVTEQTIAWAGMLRIDVPEDEGKPAFTRFYSPASVYCISPVSEEIARELLKTCRNVPVSRYELPQLAEKYDKIGGDQEEVPFE